MSGITGLEDISLSKESSGRVGVQGTTALVFAHEASGGESGIDLASLVAPTSLAANGFVNPSPTQIAAADLLFFRKNLHLYSSVRGRLHDYDAYIVSTGTRINFLGFTLDPGEIIKGEVSDVQRTGSLTADGRYQRVTYQLPVGQTVVPLGVSFKVNDKSYNQGSSIRVYRNGIRQVRNSGNATASPSADGNYQEIDSGNGYGVSIQMNTAPSGLPDVIDVDIGLYVSDGSVELFSSIERIAGIMYSMANDLALATGNPVTNYMAASISEIERTTYAAMVLDHEARIGALEGLGTVVTTTSAQKTPVATGHYHALTGNSVVLTPGLWRLFGRGSFANNASFPGYVETGVGWFAANGADSTASPSLLSTLSNVTVLTVSYSSITSIQVPSPGVFYQAMLFHELLVRVTSGTATVYGVTYAQLTTPANARVAVAINAQKVGN